MDLYEKKKQGTTERRLGDHTGKTEWVQETEKPEGGLPPRNLQNNLGSARSLVLHFLQTFESISFLKHSASGHSL